MSETLHVQRLAAFPREQEGGNPVEVVLAAAGLSDEKMQEIATQNELPTTIFLTSVSAEQDLDEELNSRKYTARFFTASRELPWCGHSLIAAGVAISERIGAGSLSFKTKVGKIKVKTTKEDDGSFLAELTSVDTKVESATVRSVESVMGAIGWSPDDLDPKLPRRIASVGSSHLILGAADPKRLAELSVKSAPLAKALQDANLESVAIIRREDDGGITVRVFLAQDKATEDAASGSTAAAIGAYLRESGLAKASDTVTLNQGECLGHPSRLTVSYSKSGGRARVTGTARGL